MTRPSWSMVGWFPANTFFATSAPWRPSTRQAHKIAVQTHGLQTPQCKVLLRGAQGVKTKLWELSRQDWDLSTCASTGAQGRLTITSHFCLLLFYHAVGHGSCSSMVKSGKILLETDFCESKFTESRDREWDFSGTSSGYGLVETTHSFFAITTWGHH